jgi:hypothetical protein
MDHRLISMQTDSDLRGRRSRLVADCHVLLNRILLAGDHNQKPVSARDQICFFPPLQTMPMISLYLIDQLQKYQDLEETKRHWLRPRRRQRRQRRRQRRQRRTVIVLGRQNSTRCVVRMERRIPILGNWSAPFSVEQVAYYFYKFPYSDNRIVFNSLHSYMYSKKDAKGEPRVCSSTCLIS